MFGIVIVASDWYKPYIWNYHIYPFTIICYQKKWQKKKNTNATQLHLNTVGKTRATFPEVGNTTTTETMQFSLRLQKDICEFSAQPGNCRFKGPKWFTDCSRPPETDVKVQLCIRERYVELVNYTSERISSRTFRGNSFATLPVMSYYY